MNAKKCPIDVVDAFTWNMEYMKALLSAAQDKIHFYLSDGPQLAYRELLALHAEETDTLLLLMKQVLEKMEQEMETVTDLLYGIERDRTALAHTRDS